MSIKTLAILVAYLLITSSCSVNKHSSDSRSKKILNNFNHSNVGVAFTFKVVKASDWIGDYYTIVGKLSNLTDKKLFFLGSKCINESSLFEFESELCVLSPKILCGFISASYRVLEPDESYVFAFVIDCGRDLREISVIDDIEIEFQLIQPTTLLVDTKDLNISSSLKAVGKYKSRMIEGVRETVTY